ncbi:polysaccharide deacetylase family protein [Lentibacillus saliphilus]|uniref:polysaccharide deacetylase family protein n=1 Tax=Lentibacillus saliphilus TaxID=2737028 RepID=UPI001C3021C1|nr:polysaccharide deacetylase family protein [Lentibacillus saliphilus]
MKKTILLVIMLIMMLAACSTTQNDQNDQGEGQADNDVDTEENEDNAEASNDDSTNELDEEKSDEAQTEDEELVTEDEVEPLYEVSQSTWHVVPTNESANEKVVLLTIDDAPDQYALEMARTLKELDAGAIFFVNGHFMETEEKKAIVKQLYDMGFLIGNHTYSHSSLPDLSTEEQKEEIVRVNDMVEEITGERPAFFRAPFGANTDYTKEVAKQEKMVLMNWVYGYDWEKQYRTPEALTDIMVNTDLLGNGANLLMHDREWTSAALGQIVTGLRDKGYEIVKPELIKTIQ